MIIVIAITSILVITVVIWTINRIMPIKICPICSGVSLTWIWFLVANEIGYSVALEIPALLMGGSVVGLAYQLEKKLPVRSGDLRTPLLWKTLFISVGFIIAYSILARQWFVFLVLLVLILLTTVVFMLPPKERSIKSEVVENLEKKMKNCC